LLTTGNFAVLFYLVALIIWAVGSWVEPKMEHKTQMGDEAQVYYNQAMDENAKARWKYFRFAVVAAAIATVLWFLSL
jgi:uncharacterized membrane protein